MTEEQMTELFAKAMDEKIAYVVEFDRINSEAINFVKRNISYDFNLIREVLDNNSFWESQGYVDVEKTDYRHSLYSDHEFYKVKGEDFIHYMRQDDEGDFHNLVYQYSIFEDNYAGFLLFPLKEGKYWKVFFHC